MNDLLIVRAFFLALIAVAAFFLKPFQLAPPVAAGAGFLLGVAIVLFEIRLKQVSLKRLIGAAIGSVLGILGAFLISLVLERALPPQDASVGFLQILLLLLMTYVGLVVEPARARC